MRKLIILVLILFIIGCSTIQYTDSNLKIIKYKKLDKIKYDWYDEIKVNGNYCIYIKNGICDIPTNYIYGDFELITYNEYLKRK